MTLILDGHVQVTHQNFRNLSSQLLTSHALQVGRPLLPAKNANTFRQIDFEVFKGLQNDCSFVSKFWISSIPSTPVMPHGFWHFQSTMWVISGAQECSEDVHSGFTYEKHDFSVQNPLISSCGSVGYSESNLSEKSMVLGRQWDLSGQPVIKFNRNHPKTSFLDL